MIVAEYDDFVAHARQHFEEGLMRAGFTEDEARWRGIIAHSGAKTEVIIELSSRYPFQPPRVVPVDPDAVAWSWHRELDGSLCLVAEDDHEGLWWTDAPAFLDHILAWFEQAASGWPGDRPDLDLDRYFLPSEDTRLYLYGDLNQNLDGFVRFRPATNNTMRMRGGTTPRKSSKYNKDRFGYVTDLGDIAVPPRTWEDVSAQISPSVDLDRLIRSHSIDIVMLAYRRGAHDGAIVLEVWPTVDGGIAVRRLRSGADTDAARTARAGLHALELRQCSVAVVGVGALGSFIADMLARSGIRHLTLIDSDVVMPGNTVRHLVGPESVGLSKVTAVKQHLVAHRGMTAPDITLNHERLAAGEDAVKLLSGHDLVVNATADFTTTALLHVTASALSKWILSAAIQNDGANYRIDILPPLDGAKPLPSSSIDPHSCTPDVFEAGCGSPVSPTPPYAVIAAAAATVRHAIGLLVGRPIDLAGEVQELSTCAPVRPA